MMEDPTPGAMLSVDQQLDWAELNYKSPMELGWWGWFTPLRHLPCNSEQAVTCHFNETANFLVTQEVDGHGHQHLACPRPRQGVCEEGNGTWGPTTQTWERGGTGLTLGTPAPPASLLFDSCSHCP